MSSGVAPANSFDGLPDPPVTPDQGGKSRLARKPITKRQRTFLGIGYVVFAVVIFIAGIGLIQGGSRTRSLESPIPGGVTTTGRVIAVNKILIKGYVSYAPVVQFNDASGRTFQITAPTSSDQPTVGSSASVSYDPSNPNRAHDLSDSSTAWKAPYYTGVFIVILSVVMVFVVIVGLSLQARKKHRQSDDNPPSDSPVAPERRRKVVVWTMRASGLLFAPIFYFVMSPNDHHSLGVVAVLIYLVVILGMSIIMDRAFRRRSSDTPTPGRLP